MAAGAPAEDAVLVLQAHEIDVVDVQEVGGAAIGVDVLLRQFEADAGRIVVARLGVVDGQGDARRLDALDGDGLAQVGREGGDAALARQVIADEGDAFDDSGIPDLFSALVFAGGGLPCPNGEQFGRDERKTMGTKIETRLLGSRISTLIHHDARYHQFDR